MKAYLIDPEACTVRAIELDPTNRLRDYYAALDCQLVEVVSDAIPGHDLWVDEEGLINDNPHGAIFAPATYQQVFIGRAIVTGGVDDEGDTLPATCTPEEIAARIFAVTDILPGGITVCAPLVSADTQASA